METVQVRLTSTPMVHTPGILAWAKNGYAFKKDRKAMRNVVAQTYSLTEQCADDLLSGKTPYTVEGENVVFQYQEGKYRA